MSKQPHQPERRRITVAVDARGAFGGEPRGIAKCIVQLYRRLAEDRGDWRFVMFHDAPQAENPFREFENVRPVAMRMPTERWPLWRQLRLPWAALRAGADVLHCPGNVAPRYPIVPTVLTIHDLIPWEAEPAAREARRWLADVRRSARAAARIITPSRYTKSRLIATLKLASQRIHVIPWGVDPRCRPLLGARATNLAAVAARRVPHEPAAQGVDGIEARAPRPYVLAFGAIDPRKNTRGILHAWSMLPPDVRRTNRLLVVGLQPAALQELTAIVDSLEIAASCTLCGYVAEEELPGLLAGAELLCYPSLSEGFGLPVIDALASGTPVLTSNVTSLPEVAGDAAILVDPSRAASIADGLERLLQSDTMRDRLRRQGLERAARFHWPAAAERTAEILASACRRAAPAARAEALCVAEAEPR